MIEWKKLKKTKIIIDNPEVNLEAAGFENTRRSLESETNTNKRLRQFEKN